MPPTPAAAEPGGHVSRRRTDVSGHPGTQVRVEVHHRGAPVIALFEAGLGLPLEVWHPVVRRLPGVCAILVDRPGLAGSTPWEHEPVLADQVALIGDALAACSPAPDQPVALVGHSYAGLLVEAFARLDPARVAALVLVDPCLPAREAASRTLVERFPGVARWVGAAPAPGRLLGWALAAGGTLGPGGGGPGSRAIAEAYADPGHRLACVEELLRIGDEAAALIDLAARHPLPDAPVGILAATRRGGPLPLPRHRWVRQLRDRAHELTPDAQLLALRGAHLLMVDNPEGVARAVQAVLGDAPRADP